MLVLICADICVVFDSLLLFAPLPLPPVLSIAPHTLERYVLSGDFAPPQFLSQGKFVRSIHMVIRAGLYLSRQAIESKRKREGEEKKRAHDGWVAQCIPANADTV